MLDFFQYEFGLVTMTLFFLLPIDDPLWKNYRWKQDWMEKSKNLCNALFHYVIASISRENGMWCILICLLNNFLWSRFFPLLNNKDTGTRKIFKWHTVRTQSDLRSKKFMLVNSHFLVQIFMRKDARNSI